MTSENTPGDAVATRGSTAVAIPDEVIERFPALAPDTRQDMIELMAENFGQDEAMSVTNLTMVKIPSGSSAGVFSYKENGEDQTAKTLKGVVVAWQDRRNYWESEQVTNEAPDCFSRDGKVGIGLFGKGSPENPSGMCETCPMSQWHDGPAGPDGKAKRVPPPCKPQQAILLMVEEEAFPWYIQVPRTSMKNFKNYRAEVFKKLKGVAQIVTEMTLEKVKGEGVPDYFVIKFKMGEDLGKAAKRAALEVGEAMLPILNRVAPVTSEADTENVVPGEGGIPMDDAPAAVDYSGEKEGAPA
jgi:hypothetical protein